MGMMYDGLTATVFSGGQKPAPTGNSVIVRRGVVHGSRWQKRHVSRKSTDLGPLNKAGFRMNA
jgi:hypothetical protein